MLSLADPCQGRAANMWSDCQQAGTAWLLTVLDKERCSWKPACTLSIGGLIMWLVWCLAAFVGLCLLLSIVNSPFSRR